MSGILSGQAYRRIVAVAAAFGLAAFIVFASSTPPAQAAGRKCTLRVRWEGIGGTVLTDTCSNFVHTIALCAVGNDTSNQVKTAGAFFTIKDWQTFAENCENSAKEAPPTNLYYRTANGNWHLIASCGPYDTVDKIFTVHFTE